MPACMKSWLTWTPRQWHEHQDQIRFLKILGEAYQRKCSGRMENIEESWGQKNTIGVGPCLAAHWSWFDLKCHIWCPENHQRSHLHTEPEITAKHHKVWFKTKTRIRKGEIGRITKNTKSLRWTEGRWDGKSLQCHETSRKCQRGECRMLRSYHDLSEDSASSGSAIIVPAEQSLAGKGTWAVWPQS